MRKQYVYIDIYCLFRSTYWLSRI